MKYLVFILFLSFQPIVVFSQRNNEREDRLAPGDSAIIEKVKSMKKYKNENKKIRNSKIYNPNTLLRIRIAGPINDSQKLVEIYAIDSLNSYTITNYELKYWIIYDIRKNKIIAISKNSHFPDKYFDIGESVP